MSTRRHLAQPALAGVAPPADGIALAAVAGPPGAADAVGVESVAMAARGGRVGRLRRLGVLDAQEAVALVARSRRELLLRTHHYRLARVELEDCYSQATLEMLVRARRGEPFASHAHIANALEQRLISRIQDRRRAVGGRSPIEAALAHALPLAVCDSPEFSPAAEPCDVERIALVRHDLRRIVELSRSLTRDQRLVLASQLDSRHSVRAFCSEQGWTLEKYRKVAQRARARLTSLLAGDSARPAIACPVVACPASGAGSD